MFENLFFVDTECVDLTGFTGAEAFLTAMENSIVKMNSQCQELVAFYFLFCYSCHYASIKLVLFAPLMGSNFTKKTVISLGGSLVVPSSGIDVDFLQSFNTLIRDEIKADPHHQFFLVVGGGSTARKYADAGREVIGHELTPSDLDWLGIHATRLNAQLIRTIFRDIAHPYVLKHYEIIRKAEQPVVVASGWKPGWSTDYCAALVSEDYGAKTIVNLSNIEYVYDKDPKKYEDARKIEDITWTKFREIVGDEWIPGMNVPFDPIASRRAQQLGLTVAVLKGTDLKNFKNFLEGKEFRGTVIKPDNQE